MGRGRRWGVKGHDKHDIVLVILLWKKNKETHGELCANTSSHLDISVELWFGNKTPALDGSDLLDLRLFLSFEIQRGNTNQS